jgi:hypothetical protein
VSAGPFVAGLYSSRENGAFQQGTPWKGWYMQRFRRFWDIYRNDISKYTKAKMFSEIGKETKVLLRFSTGRRRKGSAETERDLEVLQ